MTHIVTTLFQNEFYKCSTMKKSSIVSHCVSDAYFCGTKMLDKSSSSPNISGANDCAISHDCGISDDSCAISHSLFLVQKLISRKFHFQKK